jgi:hypothetical protein
MSASLSFVFEWRLVIRNDESLSKAAKLVGWTLSSHMNAEGRSCNPGLNLLLRETHYGSKHTIIGAISELESAGYLEVRRSAGGRQSRHRYRRNEYEARLPKGKGAVSAPFKSAVSAPFKGAVSAPEVVRGRTSERERQRKTKGTQATTPKTRRRAAPPPENDQALRDLVDSLKHADDGSLKTFKHRYGNLPAGAFEYTTSRLHGRDIDGSDAAYAFEVLANITADLANGDTNYSGFVGSPYDDRKENA